MDAQIIINRCEGERFDKKFGKEMNLAMFLNDVVSEFKRQEELK